MGSMNLPSAGTVYLDANCAIYSVEKHPDYWPLLIPVWQAAASKSIEIITSDLTLMETLIVPLRAGNSLHVAAYESLFKQPQTRMVPISQAILREAAAIRAAAKIKTPDAIHAATARLLGVKLILTNDAGFKSVPLPPVVVLKDLLSP